MGLSQRNRSKINLPKARSDHSTPPPTSLPWLPTTRQQSCHDGVSGLCYHLNGFFDSIHEENETTNGFSDLVGSQQRPGLDPGHSLSFSEPGLPAAPRLPWNHKPSPHTPHWPRSGLSSPCFLQSPRSCGAPGWTSALSHRGSHTGALAGWPFAPHPRVPEKSCAGCTRLRTPGA